MSAAHAIRVAVLDEISMFRDTLGTALESAGFQLSSNTGDPCEFLEQLESKPADVALIGLFLRSTAGLSVLREALAVHPGLPFLVLSAGRSAAVREKSIQAGAAGFLDTLETGAPGLVEAIQRVAQGERYFPEPKGDAPAASPAAPTSEMLTRLSPREREVLSYVAAGADNLKIAAHLGISERTAKAHVQALYRKFGAENRTRLALMALRAGLRAADV